MAKRFLVIHTCGSLGKSALAGVLLMPRLGEGDLLSVETTNLDAAQFGQKVKRFDPEHFTHYVSSLTAAPGNTVTDVGASCFLVFLNGLMQTGALQMFDYVIVPTDRTQRAQTETVTTIHTLLDAGLDVDRVRILLNKATRPTQVNPIQMQFHYLFALADADPRLKVDPECFLENQPLFSTMVSLRKSWAELMADTTDYQAQLAATEGRLDAARLEIVNKITVQMMARAASRVFDRVYERLNIGPIVVPTKATEPSGVA
ncbi:hypothetical protein FAZ95_00880 [Trinickia violacea]|uniref:Plasmid stability protein StbB n=1 Tax=Trinickia violacea TaxID=2571746 RepID=A0A4P8IGR6_9BURK|nr:hypothetical protein [Trinickia violacea]QCP47862.1 hypothetical protein FAZ95_00880 [Trinickia violacea]